MDFIPYSNLKDYLRDNYRSISTYTKIYLLLSITQALRFVRDHRIVHLDLKPNNIMIFTNLVIKLIDFGESYHP
jgi:serine/threonine protein kinase